ncbi:MAG TPA: cation:dicarboxylase symporter family transporter [Longimicrobiales bacterium]|jgi:Na+/H+-dicarboxylate symporter
MPPRNGTLPRTTFPKSLTVWSLAALVAGLGLGAVGHATGSPAISLLSAVVDPLGTLWAQALQMTVLPVVVVQILAAVLRTSDGGGFGRIGGGALLLFLVMLAGGALFTVLLATPVLALYSPDPAAVDAIRAGVAGGGMAAEAAGIATGAASGFLPTILAPNLFQAAADGDILPILLFSLALGLALGRLPAERRAGITQGILALSEGLLVLIRWIILGTPVGVLAITLAMALDGGGTTAGVAFAFVVLVSLMMLAYTGVLYPVTSLLSGRPLGEFARAVAPPQVVAVATRSSIASLPALIEEAEMTLRLPDRVAGLALPLAVAVFKQNRTISAPFKLLFIAYVFGVPMAPEQIVAFVLTVIVLSFSALGVPGGGSAFASLPAYLAAGAPIEAILLLEAVDAIPDIFKTLLNVTADMSVAVILAGPRFGRRLTGLDSPPPSGGGSAYGPAVALKAPGASGPRSRPS